VLDIIFDPETRNPGEKPIKWMLIDAAIVAAIAALARLPEHLPTVVDIYVAVKVFLYTFFLQLSIERGIKPHIKHTKRGENED
jgi:hypothetical protein